MVIKKEQAEYSLYELGKKTKKIWIVVIIGLCITVLNSLITISTSIPIIKGIYVQTVGQKDDYIQRVESLVPGANILFFKQKLGEPTFINVNEENNKFKDFVFVNKYFYVDATTDADNKVVYYAVTTRNSEFNPTFKSPVYDTDGNQIVVRLGKTKFSEISNPPMKVDGCVGAHSWYYYESHYLGNPGNYQTYAFGINMSGYQPETEDNDISKIEGLCSSDIKSKNVSQDEKYQSASLINFRKNNIINTYLVTAPLEDFTPNSLGIGVDYYQVRILN